MYSSRRPRNSATKAICEPTVSGFGDFRSRAVDPDLAQNGDGHLERVVDGRLAAGFGKGRFDVGELALQRPVL